MVYVGLARDRGRLLIRDQLDGRCENVFIGPCSERLKDLCISVSSGDISFVHSPSLSSQRSPLPSSSTFYRLSRFGPKCIIFPKGTLSTYSI